MKKIKTVVLALALVFVGAGTVYALSIDRAPSVDQVKIMRKCTTCDGTGVMKERIIHGVCKGEGCEACDYQGFVIYSSTCTTCDGTGKMRVK